VSQVTNCVLLPFVLFFMLALVNRKDVMGDYTNGRFGNVVAVTTSVVMIVLTVAMLVTTMRAT